MGEILFTHQTFSPLLVKLTLHITKIITLLSLNLKSHLSVHIFALLTVGQQ